MTVRLARSAAIFLSALLLAGTASAQVKIGFPAPDFTAVDALSGKKISLSDFKGKIVVLEWNNPQCPFVKKFYSVGAMQQLQANAAKHGVEWFSINSSAEGKEGHMATDEEAQEFVSNRTAHPAHYIRDGNGEIGRAYGAKTTPHMFVIDKEGKLAYMGAIDDTPTADSADIATAKNYVTRAMIALTEGKKVALTNTQPYGCFVKY